MSASTRLHKDLDTIESLERTSRGFFWGSVTFLAFLALLALFGQLPDSGRTTIFIFSLIGMAIGAVGPAVIDSRVATIEYGLLRRIAGITPGTIYGFKNRDGDWVLTHITHPTRHDRFTYHFVNISNGQRITLHPTDVFLQIIPVIEN